MQCLHASLADWSRAVGQSPGLDQSQLAAIDQSQGGEQLLGFWAAYVLLFCDTPKVDASK